MAMCSSVCAGTDTPTKSPANDEIREAADTATTPLRATAFVGTVKGLKALLQLNFQP
jgi:hypothetical protein